MTTALAAPDAPVGVEWTALGCLVRLVVTQPGDLDVAREILIDELAAIDRACSRFRSDSELASLDMSAGGPVRVSPLLAEAVAAALYAAELTDGEVDPTVGSAMQAVGYDRDFRFVMPDGPAIEIVRRPVPGWRQIDLDLASGTLKIPAGVQLDLGATAKAFTADRAARRIGHAIRAGGVLVGLGGDIATAGQAPPGGWNVRVQDITGPVDGAAPGPVETIALHAGGIATSSTAARRWIRGGQVLHHILDPRSGVPVASCWRTVTVASSTCLDANIASTASVVRGGSAPAWLAARGSAARLVATDGTITRTPGWPPEDLR